MGAQCQIKKVSFFIFYLIFIQNHPQYQNHVFKIILLFQYDFNIADANTLYSSSVIKAKFKIEDTVREFLCLPEAPRRQCRDINEAAFQVALDLASDEARER